MLGVEPAGERRRGRPDPAASGPSCSSSARRPAASSPPTYGRADLVAANNVFAHVPDIRGFAAGLRALVKDTGMVTLEFPHLLRLIERRQYDTIYHEHYSYLSLLTATRALATAGLRVVDVDELETHGGSLRVYARPQDAPGRACRRRQGGARRRGGQRPAHGRGPRGFASEVLRIKSDLLSFLLDAAAAASRWPATARRQGQHAAQSLRNPIRPARLHRRPEPGQARQVPARHAHPDLSARPTRRDQARLRARAAVESARGDQPAARLRAVMGRPARIPDPRARHHLIWG